MLLTIDVGNSTTKLGLFLGDELVHHWRLSTVVRRTADELALAVSGLLAFEGLRIDRDIRGVSIGSVVPAMSQAFREMCLAYLPSRMVVVVQPGVRTGIPLRHDHPTELGADRIANAVAAHALYGGPAIVVDFGTAISFEAVNAAGEFVGGAIGPGIGTAADALVEHAARLPEVEVVAPASPIGRSTVTALQSGIVYGFAGQVDGIVRRIAGELGSEVTTVATGTVSDAVLHACERIDHHDPWLTLKGLQRIWERNTGG